MPSSIPYSISTRSKALQSLVSNATLFPIRLYPFSSKATNSLESLGTGSPNYSANFAPRVEHNKPTKVPRNSKFIPPNMLSCVIIGLFALIPNGIDEGG